MHFLRASLWMALVATTAFPASADESAPPDNAAVHYWCAAAVMKRPANDVEEKTLDYIEEWLRLPPKVFIERRDAVNFLAADLKPGGAMDYLHLGNSCGQCDFDAERSAAAFLPRHLDLFRSLARRCWAASNVVEGQGENLRAAQLYADVLQFSAHMCRCPQWLYAMSGEVCLEQSFDRTGAFVARKPGAEAVRALMDGLSRIPPNPLSFTRLMSFDAKFWPLGMKKAWDLSDKELDEALKAFEKNKSWASGLYDFKPNWKPAINLLRSKKPAERAVIVEGWAHELGDELRAAAKAGEGPLPESESRVSAQVERLRRLAEQEERSGSPDYPFLADWVGSGSAVLRLYGEIAIGNAKLEMGRIVCAAALFEAETGHYPDSLKLLEKYFPAGIPKDPFTGKDFLYTLEEGLPSVLAQPTGSMHQMLSDLSIGSWDYRMSMALLLKGQAEGVEDYREELQSSPSKDHN